MDEALTMGIEAQLKVAEQTLFNVANGYVYEQERIISTKEGLTKVIEQKISHPNPAMLRLFLEANKPEKYRAKKVTIERIMCRAAHAARSHIFSVSRLTFQCPFIPSAFPLFVYILRLASDEFDRCGRVLADWAARGAS
jgi:hypothetical protein